jgi:hypothetical protein
VFATTRPWLTARSSSYTGSMSDISWVLDDLAHASHKDTVTRWLRVKWDIDIKVRMDRTWYWSEWVPAAM